MTEKLPEAESPSAAPHRAWLHRGLLLLTLGALAAATWRKWGDPLIDFGCELYIPWQITKGKHLYRDIGWLGGPLAQYGNALAFALFGVSWTTLIWLNLALLAALTELIRAYFARCVAPLAGLVAGLLFLSFFAFGQRGPLSIYNYIAPYRHESIRGVLLAIGALECAAAAWGLGPERRARACQLAGLGGLLFGGVLLTKLEMALATGLALAVGLAVGFVRLGLRRAEAWAWLRWFFGGAALLPVGFVLYLAWRMPLDLALRGALGNLVTIASANPAQQAFYRHLLGLDDWPEHVARIATGCGVAGAAALGGLALERWAPRRWHLVTALGVGGATWWLSRSFVPWNWLAEPFPLLVALAAAGLGYAISTETDDQAIRRRWLPLLMWSVFALTLLSRLGLAARLDHYGFTLAMPSFLLLATLALFTLPDSMRRHAGGTGLPTCGIAAGFLIACLIAHLQLAFFYHEKKNQAIGAGGDRLLTYGAPWTEAGSILADAVDTLSRTLPADATLVVMPEGIMLNYWLRRENPTSFVAFDPYYLAARGGESVVVEELERRPPDFIALTRRDMSEYGVGWFGEDPNYGRRIMSWLVGRYEAVQAFGEWEDFGIILLQRRDAHRPAKRGI